MTRKFNLTISLMNEWFTEYNNKYFNGELPRWTFAINNATSFFGNCNCTKRLIKLSTYYDRDEIGFKNTFIHELIHEWQYIKNYGVNHGVTFKKKAAEINRDGWKIQRCSEDYNAPVNPKARRKQSDNVIIMFWNMNGKKCFSKLPKVHAKYLYNWAKEHSDKYRDIELYSVPNTVKIQEFRASKNLGYYYYDTWINELRETFSMAEAIAI